MKDLYRHVVYYVFSLTLFCTPARLAAQEELAEEGQPAREQKTQEERPLGEAPAPTAPPPPPEGQPTDKRVQIEETTVEASKEEELGFKAETQTSATKSPLLVRETPQSISVITQDLLDVRQTTNLKQALETVAGVNQYSGTGPFAGTNAFGFQAFQIRGITTYGQFELREDGFLGSPYYAQPDLAVYERIEVVKGPASVLNGRGTAGGFINRIREKPLSEAQAEFALDERGVSPFVSDANLEGYERVDFNAFYNLNHFRVALQVRNVFDKTYVEGTDRPGAYATFGSPTAVLLRLEDRLDDQLLEKTADTVTGLAGRISGLFK